MRSALIIIGVLVAGTAVIHAAGNNGPAWVEPSAMAVKRVSNIPDEQHQPNLLSNMDCTKLTYRLVGATDMRSGCFTQTAFGMLDSDSETVIFNGTDEGLPLSAYSPHQVLAPWPRALNLIALDAADTGGSYISMYKNPLAVLRDQRDWTERLRGKRLVAPPNLPFKDSAGRLLVVNPQTIAFSDGGSWLVAETLGGSFTRINLASLDRSDFAPAFGAPGKPGTLFKSQVAISDDGRYVAIGNDAAGSLKIYDLAGCGGKVCLAHEYRGFLNRQIAGLQRIRHIRFINDGLLSLEATTDGGRDGVYELAPEAQITSLIDYLGLGDSYTSGEGAFDYLPGTDTADSTCHLSANSYPLLLTDDLFSSASGHSVACSGAVIDDVGSTSDGYRGQVRGGYSLNELNESHRTKLSSIMADFSPGYVAQHRFVAGYQPRIVTVSIGGNDIGFGDILERCVVPHLSRHWSDGTCYDTYESRQEVVDLVDRTVPRWVTLYRQLQAESPGSTVYAIGYPSIASDTGKCPLNVGLNKSELEFAEELIHYLDASIKDAALNAGVSYIDISQALAGHRLCEASGSSMAVNGITAGNDFGVFGINILGRESYHPNAFGHQLIEQSILRQTGNLSSVAMSSETNHRFDTGNLLDAHKTGRVINTLAPDNVTSRSTSPGQKINVRLNGVRDGLLPGASYIVHLDGPEGAILGSLDITMDGSAAGSVKIPDNAVLGIHAIDVLGPGQNDNRPIDVTQPIYVADESDSFFAGQSVLTNPADAKPSGFGEAASSKAKGAGVADRPAPDRAPDKSYPLLPNPRHVSSKPAASMTWLFVCAVLTIPVYYWRRTIKYSSIHPVRPCNNWRKKNYENHGRCFTIVIMRKFGVVVFCVVFFVSLLALAFSASSNAALTNPKKIEKWLSQSGLYGSFVSTAIEQADKTAGDDQSGGVSLSDTAVKQAAQSAFSSKLIGRNVNLFLDGNYAWLEGRSTKPQFKIDLTAAKSDFADRVGRYVKTYLSTLPACTPAQEANIDIATVDPLSLSCRPSKLDPATEGELVASQMESNGDFLSNPVITPDTFGSGSMDGSAPYYKKYASAPQAYKFGTKIPWIAGLLVLLSAVSIYFLSARRRKGVKVIGITLVVAGVITVSVKLVSDQIFRAAERHIFNQASVGELQKSLTVFLHHLENQIVTIDLWFGIGYLLLAAILIGMLIITRQRGLRIPKPLQALTPSDNTTELPQPEPGPQSGSGAPAPLPRPTPKPRPPRPPRLVQ
jgi:hypothetical protein